jgi:hypothetical protein
MNYNKHTTINPLRTIALPRQTTSTVRSVAHGKGVMVLTLATEFKIITPRLMALLRALLAERIPRCSMLCMEQ